MTFQTGYLQSKSPKLQAPPSRGTKRPPQPIKLLHHTSKQSPISTETSFLRDASPGIELNNPFDKIPLLAEPAAAPQPASNKTPRKSRFSSFSINSSEYSPTFSVRPALSMPVYTAPVTILASVSHNNNGKQNRASVSPTGPLMSRQIVPQRAVRPEMPGRQRSHLASEAEQQVQAALATRSDVLASLDFPPFLPDFSFQPKNDTLGKEEVKGRSVSAPEVPKVRPTHLLNVQTSSMKASKVLGIVGSRPDTQGPRGWL